MAILWISAVVFLVLLFVLIVPALNNSRGRGRNVEPPVNYPRWQEYPPAYRQQNHTRRSDGIGCQPMLVLTFLVVLLVVVAIAVYGISVQAGGF